MLLTSVTLRNLYLELLQHPALAEELSGYQKSKLCEYADSEEIIATRVAKDMMGINPDYNYPEEYRNGREVEYLLNKHSPAYRDSQLVLQLLTEKPVAGVPTPQPTDKRSTDRLTVDELALLYVYIQQCITGENAEEYLKGGLTSGRALYNRFTHYSKLSNRIGFADETSKKRENMIARIQKVLPYLSDEQKNTPEREIVILNGQNE